MKTAPACRPAMEAEDLKTLEREKERPLETIARYEDESLE
jgi:hypothetical protein